MRRNRRKGYALLLVLAFLVLMLSLTSVAYRQVSSMLRIDTARAQQTVRNQGSMAALAKALALLQTGAPPTNPYVCGVTLNTDAGARTYTVTLTSAETNQWNVHVAPTTDGENPSAMPNTF